METQDQGSHSCQIGHVWEGNQGDCYNVMCKHDSKVLQKQKQGKDVKNKKYNEANTDILYSYTKLDGCFLNPALYLSYKNISYISVLYTLLYISFRLNKIIIVC